MNQPLQLVSVGPVPPGLSAGDWGPFELQACKNLDAARDRLALGPCDALLLVLPDTGGGERLAQWSALSQAVQACAVVLVTEQPGAPCAAALLARGVQDVLPLAEASAEVLARTVHLAVLRRRFERDAHSAHVTDLATGLPNQTQLLEHTNHLLALREREPAPMALLLVRVEGLATAQAALGVAAAGALRRKLAVRLRASLRASDVVASVGAESFAALLAWIDAPQAAVRVAAKLTEALTQPLRVGAHETSLAISIGVAHYPEHGKTAQALLQQAFAQAAGQAVLGRPGFGPLGARSATAAANDEAPPAGG